MIRKIIHIDAVACNGCGACVTACHEGAIELVDGKARLTREHYCDGLGDCLPACPTGAITFEEREAPAYDEAAVLAEKARKHHHHGGGCPGSRAMAFQRDEAPAPAGEQPDGAEEPRDPGGLSALPDPEQQTFAPTPASAPLRLVGEVFKTYIITEREGELCLIDKHAAHERILFEQLSEHYGNVPAQMLLVPVQVNLSAEEKQAVMEHLDLLGDAGIEAEDYGGATVLVRAVPADVPVEDVTDMLLELADRLKNGGGDALREKTEWVLHSIACRAAIKAGDRTNAREMVTLAQKILDGTVPPFCPHGRPCVLKITRKELEKQFGRLV